MTTSAKPKATATAQKPATAKSTTAGATAKKVAVKTASKVATTKTQTAAKKAKLPKPFLDNYTGSFTIVTADNFRDFLK